MQPADPGPSDPGPSKRGPSDSGFSDLGLSERGSSERGSSERGSSERGSSERGSSERGSSERGSSERGSSGIGASERGGGRVSLLTIAGEWGRIGCIGFGGPPAHIALLRALCVERRGWLSAAEFEDGVAATNMLPGPASTQLAIFCAWRLRGPAGALIGGACFIVPGLIVILGLSAVFLASYPPIWIRGAALGADAAVPAVALSAALGLAPASWRRAGAARPGRARWACYLVAGGAAAALIGPFLVLILVSCGLLEMLLRAPPASPPRLWPRGGGPRGGGPRGGGPRGGGPRGGGRSGGERGARRGALLPLLPALAGPARLAGAAAATGGLLSVAWVAFKVGALSYGGGFVIVPLMQHDAVHTYHWMTTAQFLSAVALGQVTPGPVVQTVAVVGYAAAGVGGGLLASLVAFTPSFAFVLAGGSRFDRLRGNARVQAFLTGAGPAAIGAIAGATIPLGLGLSHLWQLAVLALAAAWLLALRRGVVTAIAGAGALGVIAALAGASVA
jgi:chromate transporter